MTERIGDAVIIYPEDPIKCSECGEIKECRPYGEGGAQICYPCATATPQKKAETQRRMHERLYGKRTAS
jgi:hypothetical protein